ncbi:MAG: translation initiation factor eIF-1A [archaeon]
MFKKKKNNVPDEEQRLRLPRRDELEMFGIITQMLGADQVRVMAEDGQERSCRIPGKLRKRVWLRENDIVIIKLWDFQKEKADVVWRYLGFQVAQLKRRGLIDKLPLQE